MDSYTLKQVRLVIDSDKYGVYEINSIFALSWTELKLIGIKRKGGWLVLEIRVTGDDLWYMDVPGLVELLEASLDYIWPPFKLLSFKMENKELIDSIRNKVPGAIADFYKKFKQPRPAFLQPSII